MRHRFLLGLLADPVHPQCCPQSTASAGSSLRGWGAERELLHRPLLWGCCLNAWAIFCSCCPHGKRLQLHSVKSLIPLVYKEHGLEMCSGCKQRSRLRRGRHWSSRAVGKHRSKLIGIKGSLGYTNWPCYAMQSFLWMLRLDLALFLSIKFYFTHIVLIFI